MQIEDRWLDTASGAAISMAMEPNTDLVPCKSRDSEAPDSLPDSERPAPLPIESDWAPIMEFTAVDIFQHSPFGDILNSLKHLSLSGEPWPDYGQDGWDADDEEIQNPPTTHFVATVDDLTDMLDYDSEDIDGMDDDAGDDQEPVLTGHWKATPTHGVYMVDTPKGSDNEEQREAAKDNSAEKQPKRRRRRHPKSRLDNNSTPKDPAIEQGKPVGNEHATKQPSEQDESDNQSMPSDLTPDTPMEHKNLHKRLVATARSLKKGKTEAQNSGRHTQNEVEQGTQDRGQIWQ